MEELAKQSRINYTVVANSPYMEYFKNMAGAEEELYRKWKEITLNSSSDQSKYRVWDYPVREQYTHILKVRYIFLVHRDIMIHHMHLRTPLLKFFLFLKKESHVINYICGTIHKKKFWQLNYVLTPKIQKALELH